MAVGLKVEKAMLIKAPSGLGGIGGALAGAAMGAATSLGGIGAWFSGTWDKDAGFAFRFNPETLTESKSARFTEQTTTGSQGAAQNHYAGTHSASLSFKILLDEWEAPPGLGKDVGELVKKLCTLTDPEDPTAENSRPPEMSFVWGKYHFKGYVESINATYLLFNKDGTPARAEVTIAMKGSHEPPRGQNPTSGGPSGRRTQQLIEGDNLQTLAYKEYGDPNYWRAIAEVNGIDDPLAVPPGVHLLLPSKSDAAGLR